MRIFRKKRNPAKKLELAQMKDKITSRLSELYSWGHHSQIEPSILERAIKQIQAFEKQLLTVDKLLAV